MRSPDSSDAHPTYGKASMRILDPTSLAQHIDRMYRAAWALCGSREDAEDIVQETFARVLSRPRVVHGDEDLPYLLRAVRNTFLTDRRAARRRPSTVATLDDVMAEDPSPVERPEGALEMRELYATMSGMREDFRLALVAVDVLGLSYGEASRALKVPEGTLATRVFRARSRLAARVLAPESRVPNAARRRAASTAGAAGARTSG
jgi:RNA polymerase sigma-70 factor (ECF subfamily)